MDILKDWVITKGGVWRKVYNKPVPKKPKYNKKKRVKDRARKKVSDRWENSKHLVKSRKESEMSAGELKIAEVLKNNGVKFIREYHTTYCYNTKTKHLLFFDFYLPEQNAVIEFDGPHHFKPVYGEDKLKQQKYKDGRKNKYCAKRGIPLLRIKYWQSGDIELIICGWFDEQF